jgi:cytochrome c
MKHCIASFSSLVILSLLSIGGQARATAEFASQAEAQALVKKGVSYIKTNGRETGYAEFSKKENSFKDRDLYLVVYGRTRTRCE